MWLGFEPDPPAPRKWELAMYVEMHVCMHASLAKHVKRISSFGERGRTQPSVGLRSNPNQQQSHGAPQPAPELMLFDAFRIFRAFVLSRFQCSFSRCAMHDYVCHFALRPVFSLSKPKCQQNQANKQSSKQGPTQKTNGRGPQGNTKSMPKPASSPRSRNSIIRARGSGVG